MLAKSSHLAEKYLVNFQNDGFCLRRREEARVNRNQILWLQGCCALITGVVWLSPPALKGPTVVSIAVLIWALFAFASIPLEFLENWNHRFSSFFGFLFFMLFSALGLLGITAKSYLLVWGFIPAFSFVLALIGRYQGVARKQRKRRRDPEELLIPPEKDPTKLS